MEALWRVKFERIRITGVGWNARHGYDPRLWGEARALPRFARRQDLGLGLRDFDRLRAWISPQRDPGVLNAIPINTNSKRAVHSVRNVLRNRRAHCIEAHLSRLRALIHGERRRDASDCDLSDYPHVITLFRRKGAWGSISKTTAWRCVIAIRFIAACASSHCPTSTSTATNAAGAPCVVTRGR